MSHVRVDTNQLRRDAAALTDIAQQLRDDLRSWTAGLHVETPAHDAVSRQVAATFRSVTQSFDAELARAVGSLDSVAAALRAQAAGYDSADTVTGPPNTARTA